MAIHEALEELFDRDRGRLAFGGKLPGDPGRDLGNPRVIPNRIVPGRKFRGSEVELMELLEGGSRNRTG